MRRWISQVLLIALALCAGPALAIGHAGAPVPTFDAAALRWRFVGPLRAGRTVAVTGVVGRPHRYYIAAVDGGIWRSDDTGRTWRPIFEGKPTQSIGALAVAPSNRRVLYAGSGEGLRRPDLSVGDGMWRSEDAGTTWTHAGLRHAQQINAIAVDPRDPMHLYVAVLGNPYGPSAQRGLYESHSGGARWHRILGDGPDTGAVDVVIDPNAPATLYADLWASRNAPWHFTRVYQRYVDDGLFKSTDGGKTWRRLSNGLPKQVGRIGVAVAPTNSRQLYALVDGRHHCGFYASSDGGAHWTQRNDEHRICGRGEDFAGLAVDPRQPETVYVANTSTYRSTDGGRHFVAIKGAPGGDDYHTIWINPHHPRTLLLGSDQGATLSIDGGATWSSWYNQPTAEMYHVDADHRFVYRLCGGQQESGSACVRSRGNWGETTMRDWETAGAEEYGYVVPDPLHTGIFFGGKVTRFSERTGETHDVSPVIFPSSSKRYRFDRTAPLIFNHFDKHTLYLGANVIFATDDGGMHWRVISPDLTRKHPPAPATMAGFLGDDPHHGHHRGVVYAIAPSYVNAATMWAGTDDGLVWVTRNGGHTWHNVTPPNLAPWSKIAQIDASHFSAGSAYVAINRFRDNDLHPYVDVTHDFGRTWRSATAGLPQQPVNAVRQDPVRRGLLYAATETGVDVSFDDGRHWQSLQSNLPATSIRDLIVHGNDLAVATHGRGFWILDDVTPLRQWSAHVAAQRAYLFAPEQAYRVRRDVNTDTPLPPEVPHGTNPPNGAIIDYALRTAAKHVVVEIFDAHGRLVRGFSSGASAPPPLHRLNVPTYWSAPFRKPGTSAGVHRFVWNLHEPAPQSVEAGLPIAAVPHDTPRVPQGALVLPGRYTVRLIVDGKAQSRPLQITMDPRVNVTAAALRAQYRIAHTLCTLMDRSYAAMRRAAGLHDAIATRAFARRNARATELLLSVDGADAAPTSQASAAFTTLQAEIDRALGKPTHGRPRNSGY
ncbi:MAG: WD40/YVTN/BNR-like repeat-containing protein [Vulcanimicrobiaceae bacterium]